MSNDPAPRQSKSAIGPDWEAIARFLAQESPAEEARSVREWLDTHPVDRDLVERLDVIATIEVPEDLNIEGALGRVRTRMSEAPSRPRLKVERGIRAPAPLPWKAIGVASFAAAAAAAVAFVVFRGASGMPAADPSASSVAARVYRTNIGQRDSITLADGSRVILGPDSRLTVPGGAGRSVELQGDGYFDVKHDATKPFSVRVGRAIVEDVGTTFTVESDDGDTTTVSVMTGSVRLRANDSSADAGSVLAAGDRGSMTIDGHVSTYPHTAVSDDAAWTSGRLVFRDASLTRVAAEIHRWYGVNLHIADTSLRNSHIANSFDFSGESVDQVLKVIGLTLGAHVERQGDSATISLRHGPASAR